MGFIKIPFKRRRNADKCWTYRRTGRMGRLFGNSNAKSRFALGLQVQAHSWRTAFARAHFVPASRSLLYFGNPYSLKRWELLYRLTC